LLKLPELFKYLFLLKSRICGFLTILLAIKQKIVTFLSLQTIRQCLPAIFFLGGFVWDALTIGKQVQQSDLIIFSTYLVAAGLILWWLAHHAEKSEEQLNAHLTEGKILRILPKKWREAAPYFLLQFLFGSLLSALFILYFKSASYAYALFWSLLLAGTLVGNEFLELHYKQSTISWTMFGFCSILLLNFLLPCLFGSIHWFWFVLSTMAGAGSTHYFYIKAHQVKLVANNDAIQISPPPISQKSKFSTSIIPTWLVAALLMVAYFSDVIPPVPLVKLDVRVGTSLTKTTRDYQLSVDAIPWWQFWRLLSGDVHIGAGERLYCVTAVFAPQGLKTRLYHRWQHKQGANWVTTSRIGFSLNGGRLAGFRGNTYKKNLAAGNWRVIVETEDQHTVSVDNFTVFIDATNTPISRKQVKI